MANIKFSRKEIEKNIKLTPEIIKKIDLFGTTATLGEDFIEIEVMPNRPDLISPQGFVKALKAFIGRDTGIKEYKIKDSKYKLIVDKSLPKEWPYAAACIVKNIKFDDSKIKEVIQIQEKLSSTILRERKKGGFGIYPLEMISFPVTFKGMSPDKINFRPLDYPESITGRQILLKHPAGRIYAHICDTWESLPIFIDSKDKIMSMPPIINSNDLGKIDENTKEVFIEATGPDYNIVKKSLIILATSLADMGGEIYSIECTQQNKSKENIPNFSSEKIKISLEEINRILGLNLKERDLEKLLPRMGYDYHNGKVSIPPWRIDILHPVDIIEDIAIAYGYENFVPEISRVATIGQKSRKNDIERKIAEILVGVGLTEISSFHLV